MASNIKLIQHPRHEVHPLEPRDCSEEPCLPLCRICNRSISADAYACGKCHFYTHRVCAEAPPRIDTHPLHTQHPLVLIHHSLSAEGKTCNSCLMSYKTVFSCDECDFNLDIRCALSTLSDRGGTPGKALEQIMLPLHPHTLTSFSTRNEFVSDGDCVICKGSVQGEGYTCLRRCCSFLIHKRCLSDLSYKDGTKAPKVYHRHPLETFLGEHAGSSRCVNCSSHDEWSREFIGCAECQVFYCRDCAQIPESIEYYRHPDHTLVLLMNCADNWERRCDSCFFFLGNEFCYGCPSCEFFVDARCALKVLSYSKEGMSAEIELSWHQHPLHLCHRGTDLCYCCSYRQDKSVEPMYACREDDCPLHLHKRCTEVQSTIIHPHHPDHPITLFLRKGLKYCNACSSELINSLSFSCELCSFYLHVNCAASVPTRKHPLHEHELLGLEEAPFWKCNRCRNNLSSPFFRCVPCDFNLHEECMDLPPQVLNSKVHWHTLTLHESYIEDDSGEYYCDLCEQSRDVRFGAYVCLQCSARWAYHIECVFPELRKVYEKQGHTSAIRTLNKRIARKNEEVHAVEVKLEEVKRELDQLMKERDELISGEEDCGTSTKE